MGLIFIEGHYFSNEIFRLLICILISMQNFTTKYLSTFDLVFPWPTCLKSSHGSTDHSNPKNHHPSRYTLPETNKSPLKIGLPRKVVFPTIPCSGAKMLGGYTFWIMLANIYTPRKLTNVPWKMIGLEDDPFLLKWSLFRVHASFQGCNLRLGKNW